MKYPTAPRWILGLVLLAGCSKPELTLPEWTPITVEETRDALENPTGEVKFLDDNEVFDAIAERLPYLEGQARFTARVLTVVADVAIQVAETQDAAVGEDKPTNTTRGTSFFVGVACPGSLSNPKYDFTRGEVRLDSAELMGISTEALLDGSDLLITFRDCDLGPLTVRGKAPTAYSIDPAQLSEKLTPDPDAKPTGLILNLSGVSISGGGFPISYGAFLCEGVRTCLEKQWVGVVLDGGEAGTYVLEATFTSDYFGMPSALDVVLRASDGQLRCVYSAVSGELRCDPPE